jgi:FAD binding domain-containing protein
VALDNIAVKTLADQLDGYVVTPTDEIFDEVRRVWNGAIDRRPAVIVRCRDANDVSLALAFARSAGLPVVVRGGGHSVAGLSTCDGGMMIDLSLMKLIELDVIGKRVWAQAGVLGGELDATTQREGLGTTLGTVSHTGIAGLTLGGGMGWVMRKHGLACDNLRSVEAVLADGSIVQANEDSHPDLFWALRGGGGQFAIATRFQYELHPFGPEIALTQIAFDPADAALALRAARDLAIGAPAERNMWLGYLPLPDIPALPAELRGKYVFLIMGFSMVPTDSAWLTPLCDLKPLLVESTACDYFQLQTMFDEDNRHGVRAYSKGAFIANLSDDALDIFAEHAQRASGEALVYLQQMGGKVVEQGGVPAVQGRIAEYVLNIIARWPDGGDDTRVREWVRDFVAAMRPYSLGTTPLNFEGDTAADSAGTVYGEAVHRLRHVKELYDPETVFGELRA